jgi:hypothetical protein
MEDIVIFVECLYKDQVIAFCQERGYSCLVVSAPLFPNETLDIRYRNIKAFHQDRHKILYEMDQVIAPIRIQADGLTFTMKRELTKEEQKQRQTKDNHATVVYHTHERLVGTFI